MKRLIVILLLLKFSFASFSSTKKDSLLNQLKFEMNRKAIYDEQKLSRIKAIESALSKNKGNRYHQLTRLFDEYEYFKFDSAYLYGKKLLEISTEMQDQVKLAQSKVKIASLLLHAGMFKETFDYLAQIDESKLDRKYKYDLYCLKSGAYSNLAIYNNDPNFTPHYNRKAIEYLDSAKAVCQPNSLDLLFTLGNRQVVAGDINKQPTYFLQILENHQLTAHNRARLLTALAAFYQDKTENDERICLLAESALFDIRSSTRETLASLLLAEDLFKNGHLEDAYLFIQQSRDDAGFYGNRLRKLKIESILPDIAARINMKSQQDKNRFMIYSAFISLITIVIALISFLIFVQLRKLKVKERIIQDKNRELENINLQLSIINDKLREYATVNEKYIGYFFDVISGYILKLDRLKKLVERRILARRYGEILPSLHEINIKKEREVLFNTFDSVFMSIFPNFIEVFNSLLSKEHQIWPKQPDLLNTDLRIFALMRLGIQDVKAIAVILEYSANTIYVYKMRIKARALVPGDEFDQIIMSVKAV